MKCDYLFNDAHPLLPFTWAMEANTHPNSLPPLNSVPVAPRLGDDMRPLPGEWPCANAVRTGWNYVPDHRQRLDERGRVIEGSGTPYWMPGDTHSSPARYMADIGPLPQGHSLTHPEKPLAVAQDEKRREIDAGYEAALVAALTMPSANPTPMTVAVETSALLAVDPDAVDSIKTVLDARRAELLNLVDAAQSVADVEAIAVSYPV